MKCTRAAGLLVLCVVSTPAVGSPVERVVNLLTDLQEKLELDGRAEQQVYDKYACWCEKTTDRKAGDITRAQDELRALGQTILSLKGKIATLASEIDELSAEIAAINEATRKATSIRSKENAAWADETAEMKQAMAALQQAITVLVAGSELAPKDPNQTMTLLQTSTAGAAVRAVIGAMPSTASLRPGQVARLEQLSAFVQTGSEYAPQSFTIQGILTDMYNTWASDLESATQAEATGNREFEDFMNTKAVEKKAAEELKKKKEGQKAEAESRLADTQQVYDDTSAQKEADIKFFDETKASCLATHEAWEIREGLRTEEISGVKAALVILTDDSNRELFATTIKAGKSTGASDSYDTGRDIAPTAFLQVRSSDSAAAAAARAYATLKRSATESHSLRLAALAARVRVGKFGQFEEVIESIRVMIQKLKDEGQADIEKRDQCKDEYQKIESTVKNVTWLIEKNVAKIDKLEQLIQLRTEQKNKAAADIQQVDDDKAALTAERTEQNTAFSASKASDQEAIDALMDARRVLTEYFRKNDIDYGPIQGSVKGAAFAQRAGPDFDISADQAPEAVFSGKGKRKGETKDIVSIMTMLIEDLNDEIKNDMQAEENAQLEYMGMIDELNALRKDLVDKKQSLANAIAKRDGEKTDEELDKTDNDGDLKAEQDYKADIKVDCDFAIRTFSKRDAARQAEMLGLVGAKDFLAGALPGKAGLLQAKRVTFDDKALPSARFLGLGR